MIKREPAGTDRALAFTLKVGAYTAFLLILAGIVVQRWSSVGARIATAGLLVLLATPVLFFIAINLRPNNFARYIIPAVPFLCITAAVALRTVVGTLP